MSYEVDVELLYGSVRKFDWECEELCKHSRRHTYMRCDDPLLVTLHHTALRSLLHFVDRMIDVDLGPLVDMR